MSLPRTFAQTRGFPFPPERVEPIHTEGLAATGRAHALPVPPDTSSTIYPAGCCPSASDLEELLDSPQQQQTVIDAINMVAKANHLGTNCPHVQKRLHKHKQINTMEGHVMYSKSLAEANREERLRLCKAVLDSVTDGLDRTPLDEWTQQHLQDHTDDMYRAAGLAHQLNVMRQQIAFVSSGTLFELEKMPPNQQLILNKMLEASPPIYGHVMAQMISNPSLPIHTSDLPSRAKLLDANARLLVTQGNYPSFNECVPGRTKTSGDCNEGFTSVLHKHNMKVDSQRQVFADAYPAGHAYADVHTDGDKGRNVRQVPHDRLIRSTFGGEGDVAQLLQFFAQMEMDQIRCVRQVAARLQGTELDEKTLTWGDSGKRAWGQNVLTGAAAERRTVVMASEMVIIHPQAFLQSERAINVTPDKKAATASVLVTLHNDMRRVPRRDGFSLLNHDAPAMLVKDAAFHKFSEMSTTGPWIDRKGNLQWDYVHAAGFKGARSVRNGKLGGAANKAAHIEREGYIINEHGKQCIKGLRDFAILGGAAHAKIHTAKALDEHHTHLCFVPEGCVSQMGERIRCI